MNVLILASMILLLACTTWLTLYLRYKFRFIAARVDSAQAHTNNFVWTSRTLDQYIDSDIILPPPGPWTLDSTAISTLCSLILQEKPKIIVELGSGLSTVIIASLVKKTGGILISIDHDETFGAITRDYLEVNGLNKVVDMRIATLIPVQGEQDALWYDTEVIKDLHDIDLLVIDGPPKPIDPMIRRHALPTLAKHMSSRSFVFVDDANRDGERKILRQWEIDFPIKNIRIFGYPKSHAIMTFVN